MQNGVNSSQAKQIDVEKIFKEKNPRLYKWIPGFVFRYLKRIIHQKEINKFMRDNHHILGVPWATQVVKYFKIHLIVKGLDNLPESGGGVIASNHPTGAFDAMPLIHAVGMRRTDQRFLVNDILMNLDNLKHMFIPVNKHGRNPADLIRHIDEGYDSGKLILVFPSGLVSRRRKGIIKDLEWKKSFVTKARQFRRPIIPTYISGRNSNFFYNLSAFRTALGIKANIEMLYLSDEMFRQRSKTTTIIFGKPVDPEFLHGKSDSKWANLLRDFVYELPKDPDLDFRDYVERLKHKN